MLVLSSPEVNALLPVIPRKHIIIFPFQCPLISDFVVQNTWYKIFLRRYLAASDNKKKTHLRNNKPKRALSYFIQKLGVLYLNSSSKVNSIIVEWFVTLLYIFVMSTKNALVINQTTTSDLKFEKLSHSSLSNKMMI